MAKINFQAPRSRPRTASYILRELFEIMEADQLHLKDVAKKMKRTHVTLSRWRNGHVDPGVIETEALAEVLGYRVFVEKIK